MFLVLIVPKTLAIAAIDQARYETGNNDCSDQNGGYNEIKIIHGFIFPIIFPFAST